MATLIYFFSSKHFKYFSVNLIVPAQVWTDPNAAIESKDSIIRKPVLEAVPELLPTFVARPNVFVVYPDDSNDIEEEEQATILDMQIVPDEVTTEAVDE